MSAPSEAPVARQVLPETPAHAPSEAGLLLLARAAVEDGATRAGLAADLAPLFTHKLSPQEWKRYADKEAGALIAAGLATECKGRISATPRGAEAAAEYLGLKSLDGLTWASLRDLSLIAKGLGIEKEAASRLKPLVRVEGLRALVVQKSFGLSVKKNEPPQKLRAKLAVLALERAFGNRIKAGIGKGSALSSKAGRLLAGQLLTPPRAVQTDLKLIAALEAQCAGTVDSSLEGLRKAILRNLGARVLEADAQRAAAVPHEPPRPTVVRSIDPAPPLAPPANDPAPAAAMPPPSVRPDLSEFSAAVKRAANARAEGWPGSRKAHISRVWDTIRESEERWQLSEIEFKCMLAEAHRAGAVVLANADLKDKNKIKELESSAVPYKNTVWHFVRVED